jgi:hypothetical protein
MVLPRDQLGPTAAEFEVDGDESGPETAAQVADNTIDPNDKGKTIRRAGGVAGYQLTYADSRPLTALTHGGGLVSISTSVDTFETDSAARELLVKEVRDYTRLEGKTLDGFKLEKFESFDAAVGDEAWGLEFSGVVSGIRLYVTGVYFRHGRLVGSAGFLRADSTVERAAATRLALALEARIERRLTGKLVDRSVPLPDKGSKSSGRKSRNLDPKEFTLRASDLPGSSVAGEGYREHGDVRSYLRELNLRRNRLGKSSVLYFRAMTQVLADPESADDFVGYSQSAEGARELTRSLAQGALKISPEGMLAGPLPMDGKDAAAIVSYFGPQGKRLTAVMVFVRYESLIGSVTAVGRGNELNPRDVTALIPKLRARLRAGA